MQEVPEAAPTAGLPTAKPSGDPSGDPADLVLLVAQPRGTDPSTAHGSRAVFPRLAVKLLV